MPPLKGDDGSASGITPPAPFGVWGDSDSGDGVAGTSRSGDGVYGQSGKAIYESVGPVKQEKTNKSTLAWGGAVKGARRAFISTLDRPSPCP